MSQEQFETLGYALIKSETLKAERAACQALSRRCDAQEAELAVARADLSRVGLELAALRAALDETGGKLGAAQSALERQWAEKAERKAQIKALAAQFDELKAAKKSERALLLAGQERTQAKLEALRQRAEALKTSLDEAAERSGKAALKADAEKRRILAETGAQIERLEASLAVAEADRARTADKLQTHRDRAEQLRVALDEASGEGKRLAKELANARTQVAGLERRLTEAQLADAKARAGLEAKLELARARHSDAHARFQAFSALADTQRAESKEQIAFLRSTQDALREALAAKQTKLEGALQQRETFKQQASSARSELERAHRLLSQASLDLDGERVSRRSLQDALLQELSRREELILGAENERLLADGAAGAAAYWVDLARTLVQTGDREREARAWERALALEPQNMAAHGGLAQALESLGRRQEAIGHLRILADAVPEDAEVWRRLGRLLNEVDDAEAAVDAWRRVLGLSPEDLQAHGRIGKLLLNDLYRPAEALPHLRVAAETAEADARSEHLERLARALEETGQSAEAIGAWQRVLAIADGREPHEHLAQLLYNAGRIEEAEPHFVAAGLPLPQRGSLAVASGSKHMVFEQDGRVEKASYTFYRGEHTNFYPKDESLERPDFIQQYCMLGLAPAAPLFDSGSSIVAFGSCFASHISEYLFQLGYNVSTKRKNLAYISNMGDGIVNTFAIRQQFEWAWDNRQPQVDLWHGYDAKALGYDEEVRLETRTLFDEAECFIITLGLSEVWCDAPTGEVFWRAVPKEHFDPSRHQFRVTTQRENLDNVRAIHAIIRAHRPDAKIVLTLSPIPLTATFRPISCLVADGASKAILRAALDEFFSEAQAGDPNLYYFPSYEIALRCFEAPYMEDRRHVHKHVLDLNMAVFERYYCRTGMSDADLLARFGEARRLDDLVRREGHWAAPRSNELHRSAPKPAAAEPRPAATRRRPKQLSH